MGPFSINLIKEQAPSPAARRRIFLGMLGYVFACGCALILASYGATRKLVMTSNMRDEINRLEAGFRKNHSGHSDILLFGRNLKLQVEQASQKLELINKICAGRTELARVLLALSAPLPANVNISGVQLDREKKTLEFDVDFPVGGANETIDATQLIAAWNGNAALMSELSKIGSVRSQKRTVEGRVVENWHFTCNLLKGAD